MSKTAILSRGSSIFERPTVSISKTSGSNQKTIPPLPPKLEASCNLGDSSSLLLSSSLLSMDIPSIGKGYSNNPLFNTMPRFYSNANVSNNILSHHYYKIQIFEFLYKQKAIDMTSGYFANELEWYYMYSNIKDNIEFVINEEHQKACTSKYQSLGSYELPFIPKIEAIIQNKSQFCLVKPEHNDQLEKLIESNRELVAKVESLSTQFTDIDERIHTMEDQMVAFNTKVENLTIKLNSVYSEYEEVIQLSESMVMLTGDIASGEADIIS